MKRRATDEKTPMPQIYREGTANLTSSEQAEMPTFQSVDSSLYRSRRGKVPPSPSSREELVIVSPYDVSNENVPFFQVSLHDNDILIFTTESHINAISNVDTLFMDGTFKTVPQLYKQLFVIHDFVGQRLMPRVFVLMARKDVNSYRAVFRWLKQFAQDHNLEINPSNVVSDFEASLHSALQNELPNSRHHGCYFHYTQAVWRKVQTFGLAQMYSENAEIRKTIKKLISLALLPVATVRNSFNLLRESSNPLLLPLINYFNGQWMTRMPLGRWNCYNSEFRTNNHVEGWNRRFNSLVRRHHENVWHFISCLKDEETSTAVALNQFAAGQNISGVRNKKYKRIEERFRRLKRRFERGDANLQDFWSSVSHLVGAK